MKTWICVFYMVAACLLVSCGTYVSLPEYVPASVNLGAGKVVQVAASGHYPLARELTSATTQALVNSGYYRATDAGAMPWGGQPAVIWRIDRSHPNEDGYSDIRVDVNVYDSSRSVVYSDSFSRYVKDHRGHSERNRDREKKHRHRALDYSDYDYRYMAQSMAEDVVERMIPRKSTYYVSVDTDEKKNPLLLQAVRMLDSGNVAAAESLARQARQAVPNDPENEFVLGLVERVRKNYASSDAHFRAAHNMAPDSKYAEAISKNVALQRNEAAYRSQMGY